MLVACGEEFLHRDGGSVGVDLDRGAGDRVDEEPVPLGDLSGEVTRRVGVDQSGPDGFGGVLVSAYQGLGGEGDLHARPDRPEPAGPVGPVGGVDHGRSAEDEVAEDVGPQLVHGSGVWRRILPGGIRRVSLLARPDLIRPSAASPRIPGVLHRLSHLGEPVEHPHGDDGGEVGDEVRHPVGPVEDPHAPLRRRSRVPL
ncbi:MAG: hypothetical protein K0S49_2040, partial [Microbacterium sp.]|nr:hypothetical protein [Microbacterium sp.]